MNIEISESTKRLLLLHQSAEEDFRQMSSENWSDETTANYIKSLEALRHCPEEKIRRLAQAVDTNLNPATASEEQFQQMRDAEHDLIRLSLRVRDLRPKEVTAKAN